MLTEQMKDIVKKVWAGGVPTQADVKRMNTELRPLLIQRAYDRVIGVKG